MADFSITQTENDDDDRTSHDVLPSGNREPTCHSLDHQQHVAGDGGHRAVASDDEPGVEQRQSLLLEVGQRRAGPDRPAAALHAFRNERLLREPALPLLHQGRGGARRPHREPARAHGRVHPARFRGREQLARAVPARLTGQLSEVLPRPEQAAREAQPQLEVQGLPSQGDLRAHGTICDGARIQNCAAQAGVQRDCRDSDRRHPRQERSPSHDYGRLGPLHGTACVESVTIWASKAADGRRVLKIHGPCKNAGITKRDLPSELRRFFAP